MKVLDRASAWQASNRDGPFAVLISSFLFRFDSLMRLNAYDNTRTTKERR